MPKKNKAKKKSKNNFARICILIFIILLCPIIFWASQYPQLISSFGKTTYKLSPLGYTYGSIAPIDRYPSNDPPPENHPDINLDIRGSIPATGEKYPINIGGPSDPKAPQIWTILGHIPKIISLYKINSWDWNSNQKGPPMPVSGDSGSSTGKIQQVGFETNPGEEIFVPDSGYRIGDNYQVMVLYVDENSITIKYGREDDIGIKFGYAIQIEGIAVDSNLLSLYKQLHAQGRGELPALTGKQAMGTAIGDEIRVVIRDTGNFLDPRSKKDWWAAVDYPYPHDQSSPPTSIPRTVTSTPIPTAQIVNPTTYIPQPTNYVPSPTIYIPPTQPADRQPTAFIPRTKTIIIPTITPTPTIAPTPTPSFFAIMKTNWNKLFTTLKDLTKNILP